MWTRVALLLFALAAASADFGWKSGQQYTYKVTTKTLSGLHESPQYTGLVVKAQLVIHAKSEKELIAVIDSAQKAQIHTQLQKGYEFDIPKEMLQFQPFTLTKQPFVIRFKEGIVDELVISKEVPIWEVNMIKSIVSQLQVDTQGKRIIPSKLNMIPQQENDVTAVYKVMEDTIEGECEVLYDISPLPKYILQRKPYLAPLHEMVKDEPMMTVMKTKNFTNCHHRPGYHHGITGMTSWEATTNKMGDFLSRSSVGKVIISGSLRSYTIHSSETTNVVTVTSELGSHGVGAVLSRVNLTLISVKKSEQQVENPSHPQSIKNLVYSYNHPTATDEEARQKWERGNELPVKVPKGKNTRFVRSITDEQNKKYSSRSSEEYSSTSVESWHQETPKLESVPQNPFLPYFVGCSGHSIQHCKNVDVIQVVKKLCEQIGTQLQEPNHIPQTNTLERFSILMKVIRTLDAQQLQKITEDLWVKGEGEAKTGTQDPRRSYWMTFRDAVAQAGTGPALVTIKKWILTDKVRGEEAAQLIASLTESTTHPTIEYMQAFFGLVKDQKVMNQDFLNTTVIYSFTRLVRMAQVGRKSSHNLYPVHAFGRFMPVDDAVVATEYIPYFGSKLQQAVQEQDSPKIQIYIRALGNTAHPKILTVFEPYLEGQLPMTDFQRMLIVLSLNDLAWIHPRIARSVLYKTFANVGEIHQVRVSALYMLMKTYPPAVMLQRIARYSHDDPSIQVRSAIKSTIESAALLKNPENIKLRRKAQAAVNMLTPEVFGIHYSRKNVTDFFLEGLNLGYTSDLAYIGSEDSIIPSTVLFGVRTEVHGFQRAPVKAQAMVSSIQDLVDFLESIFTVPDKMSKEETGKDQEWSYEKVGKMLNLEHEIMKQVEGNLLYRFAGGERVYSFDNHTIESVFEKLLRLPNTLSTGCKSLYQKLYYSHSIDIGFPTVTGLPFVYTLEVPRLLYGKGDINLKVDNSQKTTKGKNPLSEMAKFGGEISFKGVYTSRTQSKVGFVTPFDHHMYVASIKREHQINIPLRMEVNADLMEKKVKLNIQPYDKTGDLKVFSYNSQQFTSLVDITEFKPIAEVQNTKKVNVHQPQKYQSVIGDKDGLGLRIEVESQRRFLDWQTVRMLIDRHCKISPFIFPTAGENMLDTKIDIYYDKTFAQSVVFNLGVYQSLRSGKTGEKVITPARQGGAVQEVITEIQKGIKSPEGVVVDLEWEVKGQKNVKYSTVFGYGYSPIAEEKRFVLRYNKKGDKNYELCLDGVEKMPFVPETDFTKAIQNQPKGQISAEIRFGENGCKSGAHVTLAGKFERTNERAEYLKTLPQVVSCQNEMKHDNKLLSGCMNATYNANLLNRYIFTVQYDKVPDSVKNLTYKIYTCLRHRGFSLLSEDVVTPTQQGKIDLDVQFSPDLKSVNTHLTSPIGVARFENVRVDKYLRSIFVMHPTWNVVRRYTWNSFRQQYNGFCTIDKTKARTFDNVTYPIHLTNHWVPVFVSVPRISQEGELVGVHKIAVLTKQVSGDKREVIMHAVGSCNEFSVVVHVKPDAGITVNGKKVEYTNEKYFEHYDQRGKLIVRIYPLITGEVKFVFPECKFHFLYDGSRIQVVADTVYRNRVLGLCGDYNGEKLDYITPKGKYLRNPEEFVASWTLTNEEPYGHLKQNAEKNSVRKTVVFAGVVSDQDAGRTDKRGREFTEQQKLRGYYETSSSSSSESIENDSNCMTKRIMVVERDGKHCFSTEPQPACKPGCQVEKTTEMTAKFVCVNKTQTSSHWAQMVTRGAHIPNLGEKVNNVQELTFQAPIQCVKN